MEAGAAVLPRSWLYSWEGGRGGAVVLAVAPAPVVRSPVFCRSPCPALRSNRTVCPRLRRNRAPKPFADVVDSWCAKTAGRNGTRRSHARVYGFFFGSLGTPFFVIDSRFTIKQTDPLRHALNGTDSSSISL